DLIDEIAVGADELDKKLLKVADVEDIVKQSAVIRDKILPAMAELRVPCDKAEVMTAKEYWPFPSYADLLFGVK
ncbi:MAG: glutamine synthetase type III, partial [Clostridia bacterium]|nr:glutamine synthetase type III [Clostridia bacterium]